MDPDHPTPITTPLTPTATPAPPPTEDDSSPKPTGDPVDLTRKRCVHCSLAFASFAHVMYPCGHVCHVGCFLQRVLDLHQLRCGCEHSTTEPLHWGIDRASTAKQLALECCEPPLIPTSEPELPESTSLLSGVKESIFSFFASAAASRHSKESMPQEDQLSSKELCKLIANGTLSAEELANQQSTFAYLVGRGVKMDHFFQGGNSILSLKENLLVQTLGQLQEAGFAFKHLKLYRELTSPDQLITFPDANAGTFQRFNVSADAIMGLGYSAVALAALGLTVPNLFWGHGRSLSVEAILKSPLSYEDWRDRLGLTPELATRIGLSSRQCIQLGWPSTAVADATAEPLRVVKHPTAPHTYRQTRRRVEDVYRVPPLTNLVYE